MATVCHPRPERHQNRRRSLLELLAPYGDRASSKSDHPKPPCLASHEVAAATHGTAGASPVRQRVPGANTRVAGASVGIGP